MNKNLSTKIESEAPYAFRGRYNRKPLPEYTRADQIGEYLVEDAGILSDNKTRVEQMLLAGARLNELSKYYTYDQIERDENGLPVADQFIDMALPYGIDKLDMSDKLRRFEDGLQQRLKDEQAVKAAQAAAAEAAAAEAQKKGAAPNDNPGAPTAGGPGEGKAATE